MKESFKKGTRITHDDGTKEFQGTFKHKHLQPKPRPDGAVPFNVDTGGAGDLINVVGFIRGYRKAGIESWAYSQRDDYRNLLHTLGEEPRGKLSDLDGAINTGGKAYYYESFLNEGGRDQSAFIPWIRSQLPHNPEWIKPEILVGTEELEWANEMFKQGGAQGKKILVFPFSAWNTRSWPLPYWADLCWSLKYAGHTTVAVVPPNQSEIACLPWRIWGIQWSQTAALCKVADLVITNDSGPMFVAGCADKRTLSIVGPTKDVGTHLPSVREVSLATDHMSCVGCWFDGDKGFRSACDVACGALMRMSPESVYKLVTKELDGKLVNGHHPGYDRVSCCSTVEGAPTRPAVMTVPLSVKGTPHV